MRTIQNEFLKGTEELVKGLCDNLMYYINNNGSITFNGVEHNEEYDKDFPIDEWETTIGIISGSVIISPIQLYVKDNTLMLKYKEQELDEGGYITITDARLDEMSWHEVKEIVDILPTD